MSFQINVLNAKNVVASHAVKAGSNLTLDGQDNVNYQLVDTTTGFAPQNILATRDGANLVITLNERGATAQIVIKDYYDGNVDNVLVGLHENGNMYVYVPESGASQDAVSVLAEQVSRPQALGGEELAAPFWVWNPWWIAGAAGLLIGGVALAASGRSSDKKASDNVTHESVVANDPQTGNAGVTKKQGDPLTVDDVKDKVVIPANSGGTITAIGQVPTTDEAGNSTVPVTVTYPDGTTDVVNVPVNVTPLEITIELDPITADNKIDPTERANPAIPVTGTVTGDFKENDPITLTVNGKAYSGNVDRDGKFSIPVNGEDLHRDTTVEAKVETKNGTVTKTGSDDQPYEIVPFNVVYQPTPEALTLKQGDPLTVDDVKGKVVIPVNSGGTITAIGQVPTTDEAGNSTVPVTVTYPDGTTDVVNVPVNVTPLEITIELDPITADNKIDPTERANPAIPVTGTVTGDFKENDPITLTVNGKAYSGNVDRDGKFSIPVNGEDLHRDTTVEAKVETKNGTVTKTGSDDQPYEIVPFNVVYQPTPEALTLKQGDPLTVDDVKGKVVIPANSGGTITAIGQVPTTDEAGNSTVPVTVTYPDGTTDVVNVPVEVTPLTLTITLDSVTADNKIDSTEHANPAIPVTGTVTGDFKENDPITLTVNGKAYSGNVDRDGKFSIPVNGAELHADADLTIQAKVETTNGTVTKMAEDDQTYTKESFADAFEPTPAALSVKQGTPITEDDIKGKVTIQDGSNGQITHVGQIPATDMAGTKPAVPVTVTYPDGTTDVVNVPVEVTPLTLTITLDPVTADNKIDSTEHANPAIPVTGTVTGDFKENDPITLTVNGKAYSGNVDRDGKFSIPVNGAELHADADLTIQAKVETKNGTVTKTADDDQTYTKESFTDAFEPTPAALSVKQGTPITEDDIKGKVTISAGSNGQITHVGQIPATDMAGTKPAVPVTVTYPDGTTDVVNVPVEVTPLTLTITLDPVTADNKIDSTEHANPAIPVTGTVTGDFKENDPITLTVNGKAYSGNVDRDGKFSIPVNGAELHADADLTIQAKVETKNGTVTKTADDDQTYTKESFTDAFEPTPAALSVKQGTPITEDDIKGKVTISAGSNGQITHVGQIPATDMAGTKPAVPVTVTYPDGTTDVVNVPVEVTPLTLTITLDPVTADNKIDSTEHANPAIPVTGTVTGDFKENDPITLTVNGKAYSGNVDRDGKFSIPVNGAELHADADLTIQAKVETTNGTVTKMAEDDQTYTKESFADAFEPTPAALSVKQGTPITEDDIKGKVTIPAGSNGQITHVGQIPATDMAGTKPAVPVTVTYPDGTTDVVNVPVEVTPLEITIELDLITADNKIDLTERANQAIPVTGTVTGDFKENDPITLTVNGNEIKGTVGRDGKFSIPVNGAELYADADLTIQAKVETTNGTVTKTAEDDQTYTKESFTEAFDPTPDSLTVKKGTPISEDDIKGKVAIPEGSGGTITQVGTPPATDTAGEKPAVPVTVTYPDGTTDTVNVPVTVTEADSDKFDPTPDSLTVKKGTPISEDDIKGKVAIPEGSGGTITQVGTPPATDTAGEKPAVPVTVTYPDGTTDTVNVPVTVTEADSDKFDPTPDSLTVKKGTPISEDDIKGKVAIPAGSGGTITQVGTPPATDTAGEKPAVPVTVTYPDGTTDTVNVPVTVTEADSDKFDPTPDSLTVKKGTPISEDDIKGKVTIPADSNGQITHVGPVPTTDTAGEKPAVPVTVTYPDGTTDTVNVPVTVTEAEFAPLARDYFGQSDVIRPDNLVFIPGDKDLVRVDILDNATYEFLDRYYGDQNLFLDQPIHMGKLIADRFQDDPRDEQPDQLKEVKITTSPLYGKLVLVDTAAGTVVDAGDTIQASDLDKLYLVNLATPEEREYDDNDLTADQRIAMEQVGELKTTGKLASLGLTTENVNVGYLESAGSLLDHIGYQYVDTGGVGFNTSATETLTFGYYPFLQ